MKEKRDEIIILRTTKAEKNRIYEKMLGMGIRSLSDRDCRSADAHR